MLRSSHRRAALRPVPSLVVVLTLLLVQLTRTAFCADDDFFETRIRPIFVSHCEACHSDANKKTNGGLALDSRQGWQRGGDQGPAIVPGKPDESLLMKAIRHESDVIAMPPEESRPRLSQQQQDDLATWILQGAIDPRSQAERVGGMTKETAESWWSFQPLANLTPPEVARPEWVYNDIDRFVVSELLKHDLQPNDVTNRRTWIRRVTFDLTGLPPTPEEIHLFLNDPSEQAFAHVVDRLLASPAYGERYGRHWLDVARYADTAGDASDYPIREAGQYRNWVIQAFNSNMPWNDFLRQQIAGDIYAKENPDNQYANMVTATGFLAIGKRYGHRPLSDFQYLDFADAIDSVGRSLLGLSIGCARCHDHKYDPVTMKDYYALYGIMQSTKWAFAGGEEQKQPSDFPPLVPPNEAERLDAEKASALADMDRELAELRAKRNRLDPKYRGGGLDLDLESQELNKPPVTPWLSSGPNMVSHDAQSPFEQTFGKGTRGVRIGSGQTNDGVRMVFSPGLQTAFANTIYLSVDFRSPTDPKSAESNVNGVADPNGTSNETGAYRFYLGRGVLESIALECSISATEFAIREAGQWRIVAALESNRWYQLRIAIDSANRVINGMLHWDAGRTDFDPIELSANWDGIANTFICDAIGHRAGTVPVRDLDNLSMQSEPFPEFGSVAEQKTDLDEEIATKLADIDSEIAVLTTRRDATALTVPYKVAYGVSEGTPSNARLQLRGEPENLGDEVQRGFVAILGNDAIAHPEHSSGRKDLAEWLTSENNPLPARVAVNRIWRWHFGRGIVSSTSDFGVRGSAPTHPQLLDWLATRFIRSGWDVKDLHKCIVLSRTYRLSSDSQHASRENDADPENHLLWRFNRHALDAESLRDAMLSVSGNLNLSQPEQHPFPPVQTWAFTIHQPFHAVYESDHRSVYLMAQRNRRHPYLSLFDGADPNQSTGERLTTTTPTQSLYLMNSPLVHQWSASVAEQILNQPGERVDRIGYIYEKLIGRQATPQDIKQAENFIERYQTSPDNASPAAAWSALARVLMTSNPFLYVD